MTSIVPARASQIAYSCAYQRSHQGEQFVAEHTFGYQVAGTLTLSDGKQTCVFQPGDFRFCPRNQLMKFSKQPPAGGEFASISVYLDQLTLRQLSLEYGHPQRSLLHVPPVQPIQRLAPTKRLLGYIDSLRPYLPIQLPESKGLEALKLREAVLLLLDTRPDLQTVLFDFSEPGKIDLQQFMLRNFHFNVALSRFAYLTGRSLATFKRDFEKIFHQPPNRWLVQRRLQQAHYLLQERGFLTSDVYLDVGFKDLSHFSFAFKKQYGVAPSQLERAGASSLGHSVSR